MIKRQIIIKCGVIMRVTLTLVLVGMLIVMFNVTPISASGEGDVEVSVKVLGSVEQTPGKHDLIPLDGAEVFVYDMNKSFVDKAVSNAEGVVDFTLPAGDYTAWAYKEYSSYYWTGLDELYVRIWHNSSHATEVWCKKYPSLMSVEPVADPNPNDPPAEGGVKLIVKVTGESKPLEEAYVNIKPSDTRFYRPSENWVEPEIFILDATTNVDGTVVFKLPTKTGYNIGIVGPTMEGYGWEAGSLRFVDLANTEEACYLVTIDCVKESTTLRLLWGNDAQLTVNIILIVAVSITVLTSLVLLFKRRHQSKGSSRSNTILQIVFSILCAVAVDSEDLCYK